MAQNPDILVRVVGENPDATVGIVGGQVIEATPADEGKVVGVDAGGELVLVVPEGGVAGVPYSGSTGDVDLNQKGLLNVDRLSAVRILSGGGAFTTDGAAVLGGVYDSGFLGAHAPGAVVLGNAGMNGEIGAYNNGSVAVGSVFDTGSIRSYGYGSVALGAASNASIETGGSGSFAGGFSDDGAEIKTGPSGHGALAFGYADDGSRILAEAAGSVALGCADDYGQIGVSGEGSLLAGSVAYYAQTYVNGSYGSAMFVRAYGSGTLVEILDQGDGAIVQGHAYSDSSSAAYISVGEGSYSDGAGIFADVAGINGGYAEVYINGRGVHVLGSVRADGANSARIYTSGEPHGSLLGGCVRSSGTYDSYIYTDSPGTLTFGYVTYGGISTMGPGAVALGYAVSGGKIVSSGRGSLAGGYADSYNITASDHGSLAWGYADSYYIRANGRGAVALGWADTDNIQASADNSFQFGPGNNNRENSLGVGEGVRLLGVPLVGLPNSGEMWVDSGDVYLCSGGTSFLFTQTSAIPDAAGGAVVDAEARSALNQLLGIIRTVGFVDT